MIRKPVALDKSRRFADFRTIVCALPFLGLALTASAEVIFDNSANDLGRRFDPQGLEAGDQIVLAGSARHCTNFSFEYWGDSSVPGSFAGAVEARVRFYRNDGANYQGYATPGTLFYDSDWFSVEPTLRSTVVFLQGSDFPAGGLYLPSPEFTWSVQFRGLGPGDAAGVDLYAPIATGLGYDDYWEKDPGSGWTLKTNSNAVVSFAAKIEASNGPPPVPPSLQMIASGGQVMVSWPAAATSFVLESSPALGAAASWVRVTDGIAIANGNFVCSKPATAAAEFFRLRQQ
jgi:hypothetical protein